MLDARGSEGRRSVEEDTLSVRAAIDRAVENLRQRQEPDGHWAGDYGGPLFLLPGLVIALHVGGAMPREPRRGRMVAYLRHVQNEDGGFGLHIEDGSTVLGTALNYVALRLLGVGPEDPDARRARERLHALGGAETIPTWGKFWLATLGVYHWDGVPPLLPELYLLPRAFPLHPANLWCHTRQVFLPMAYVYGRRYTAPEDTLVRALRDEMLTERFESIDWLAARARVAPTDLHTPHTPLLQLFERVQALYAARPIPALREAALEKLADHIQHEDESTSYLTIGPVSKAMHVLIASFEDEAAFAKHLERVEDYLWDAPEGTKMQGYNGSQLWDCAFAMLAILERGEPASEHLDVLARAHDFLDDNQVAADIDDGARYYRDPIRGSWPFSTAEQTWTVSDCTAEGLKAALRLQGHVARPIAAPRLRDAARFLLDAQNDDGGWSEYERSRAPEWAELFNAAEVFGPIMRGYSYVECTSACIQALTMFREAEPRYASAEIEAAIERGLAFVRETQRADGSWIGGWGLCFTYGTWFGVDALVTGGRPEDRARVERACRFLIAHQRADGGFSESYRASVEERWIDHDHSLPVQSGWALLALLRGYEAGVLPDRRAIDRGVRYLLEAQAAGGDWPQDAISGVFNRTCMIHYDNYRHVMPLWALTRYQRVVG